MALHSSILSWNISWTEKSGQLQAMGSYRVRHNWKTEHTHITSLITKTCITAYIEVFVVAQLLSCVRLFVTPWTAAGQASLSITNSGACSNSCPLSQWHHPTISSSVVPFSFCLQSFPTPASFQISQCFTSGGQSIGASALASVLPMNIQDWFPLGWTGAWSPCSPRDSRESFPMPQFKSINSLDCLYDTTLTSIDDYRKNHSFD